MIRMLFALVATLAVFLAASLWWARDVALVPSEPKPSEAVLAPANPIAAEPFAQGPSPQEPASAPESEAAPASVSPNVDRADLFEEEIVSTPASFETNEPPPHDSDFVAAAPLAASPVASANLDQDAWAQRIRRMLSLYRRTGAEAR